MNSIELSIRNTKTKGELNLLRSNGNVPGVVYGSEENKKVAVSKKLLKKA